MGNDTLKKVLVAAVSAIALMSAFAPATSYAFNAPVHTSSIKSNRSNGARSNIESQFLKECSTEVAKAENVGGQYSGGALSYAFNAAQIRRVEECVEAKTEDANLIGRIALAGGIVSLGLVSSFFGGLWDGRGSQNVQSKIDLTGHVKGFKNNIRNHWRTP